MSDKSNNQGLPSLFTMVKPKESVDPEMVEKEKKNAQMALDRQKGCSTMTFYHQPPVNTQVVPVVVLPQPPNNGETSRPWTDEPTCPGTANLQIDEKEITLSSHIVTEINAKFRIISRLI